MDLTEISLEKLELLSTEDLLKLADNYDLDLPDSLNRWIIIGELLELGQEFAETENAADDLTENSDDNPDDVKTLPESYNETSINAILRNPAWAFVWWDFSESDIEEFEEDFDFSSILIRVSFFNIKPVAGYDVAPDETFDVTVSLDLRQQYIMIPPEAKYIRFDLAVLYDSKKAKLLKSSGILEKPDFCQLVKDYEPGKKMDLSPVMKLSGMEKLVSNHYKNHRQSFS